MNFIDDLIMIKTYMELYVSKDEELEFGIMFRGTNARVKKLSLDST
jgi:hypothetical protein